MVLALFAPPAAAQPDSHAAGKELAQRGFTSYQQQDFRAAERLFDEARTLYPTGQVLRMWGYALVALERWVEAESALQQALSTELKPLAQGDRSDVEKNLAAARDHVATLTVEADVESATAFIAGEPRQLPVRELRVDEGSYTLVIEADGYRSIERTVELSGGASETVRAEFVETAGATTHSASASSGMLPGQTAIAVVAASIGALTTGVGVSALFGAASYRASIEDDMSVHNATVGSRCSDDYAACSHNAARINRRLGHADALDRAGVGVTIAGAALLGAGIALYVLDSDDPARDVGVACTPAANDHTLALTCMGRF